MFTHVRVCLNTQLMQADELLWDLRPPGSSWPDAGGRATTERPVLLVEGGPLPSAPLPV